MQLLNVYKKNFDYLKKAYFGGKLHNAYIFYGPKNSGKFQFALDYAKFLQCTNNKEGSACDKCQNCRLASKEYIPSSIIINKQDDENIPIEEIRKIKKDIELTNFVGATKIVIVNNFHNVNYQAKDLFLKNLEEPPKNTLFILLTDEIDSIPKTILSRSIKIYFSKFYFKKILSQNFEEINKNGAPPFYFDFMNFKDEILENEENLNEDVEDLEKILKKDGFFDKVNLAKKISEDKKLKNKIENIINLLYIIFLMKNNKEVNLGIMQEKIKKLEKSINYAKILDVLEIFLNSLNYLDKYVSKRLLIENILLNI